MNPCSTACPRASGLRAVEYRQPCMCFTRFWLFQPTGPVIRRQSRGVAFRHVSSVHKYRGTPRGAFPALPIDWNPDGRACEKTVTHPSSCTFSFRRSRRLGTQSVVSSNRGEQREATRGGVSRILQLATAQTRDEAGHVGSTTFRSSWRCD